MLARTYRPWLGIVAMAVLSPLAIGEEPAKTPPAQPPAAPAPATPAQPPAAGEPAAAPATVSFMKDVAPILVQNCIACHNTRKAEGKYGMTTFAQLAKGGAQAEGHTFEPGDPDASQFVELIRLDGSPRMPYKQDPLPADKIALIERWVKEGAKYDGASPTEDWTAVLRRNTPVAIPEAYPLTMPITALAFSPNNLELASSGYHEINLWKTADGVLDRRIRGLAERVYKIAFSPDGKWMATASGDPGQFGSVKLWLAEPDGGGKPVRDLLESPDCVFSVAFSPDSKTLAAAGADRAIRFWDVETGKELATIEDHADWIYEIAFSPDGKRLASASRDKTSKVFDVVKKEALVTFPGHAAPVYTVAFSPDGKSIYTGGEDNLVRNWNPDEDAKQVRQIGGFGGTVFKLQFTTDGKQLVACGADKVIRIFDAGSAASVRNLAGHNDWVYTFALSPDGQTIASGSWDGEVRLWKLADGAPGVKLIAAPGFKTAGSTPAAR
ncbi:c-type cytochrome domain-containing protein [Singulisphaera sp. PoT]|uniref:c-type cytochrome domain-containing protein n=1 Tax=Singulisphaera sp. PoT TaxID=3411797 RepID=UPI003BF5708A